MDSHSVSLNPSKGSNEQRIDVPMRSFQGGYYPQLIALYKHLGVKFRQADFSYSFSTLTNLSDTLQRQITTTMIYNGASGRDGVSMPSNMLPPTAKSSLLSAPSSLVAHLHIYVTFMLSMFLLVVFYLRLVLFSLPIQVPESISSSWVAFSIPLWLPFPTRPRNKCLTLREWTERTTPNNAISRWLKLDVQWQHFVKEVLVPLFSAVCTAGEDRIWNHPVEELLDYIYLTFGTHHYVVLNGVRDVVRKITTPVPPSNIHLSTPIVALVPGSPDGVSVSTVDIHCASNVVFSGFEHVILATQANHAGPLLKAYCDRLPESTSPDSSHLDHHRDLVAAQTSCLENFEYCRTIVVNHTDSTLLPSCPRNWRDLNLVMTTEPPLQADASDLCLPPTYAMATHILPKLKGVYQTTNPIVPPAATTILSVAHLERAVVTICGKNALAGLWQEREENKWKWGCAGSDGGRLGSLQGAGRSRQCRVPGIWICGSYAHCGIPLLEGCVVSARNVVEQGIWASEDVDLSTLPPLW
ncbi:hypothetical protein PHLCEN_2v2297 [Hermanssonia centrifuga]|uniref:Uncharacterized protein n=1 Tax=Hermanssonia centrifuga TaxID=98765 RepID=A0A2R6RPJ0_9APHY|nr:hypothetical protein PHLCEN_2v2297 [Hermanssonia centrifuga]